MNPAGHSGPDRAKGLRAEQPRSGPRIDAFSQLASGKTRAHAAAIWLAVRAELGFDGFRDHKPPRNNVRSPPRASAWLAYRWQPAGAALPQPYAGFSTT